MSRNAVPLILIALLLLAAGGLFFYFSQGEDRPLLDGDGNGAAAADADDDEGAAAPRRSGTVGTVESDEAGAPARGSGPAASAGGTAVLLGRAVIAGSGSAVEGAAVRTEGGASGDAVAARTDARGAFRIEVEIGDVVALVIEKAPARSNRVVLDGLAAGEERDLGAIELRVGRGIEGRVLGPGGKPIAGAKVALMTHVDATADGGFDILGIMRRIFEDDEVLDSRTTTSDGRFAFEGVDDGTYALRADAEGMESTYSGSLRVSSAAASPNVDLALNEGHAFAGRVIGPDGVGIAGATVACVANPRSGATSFLAQRTRSGEDGRFRFDTVGAGRLIVFARAEGFAPSGTSDYDPTKGDLELKLGRGVTISGRVFDRATGDPIAGADLFVTSFGEPFFLETKSDEEGRYVFAAVPAETVMLVAERQGWEMHLDEREQGGMGIPAHSIEDKELAAGPVIKDVPMVRGATVRGRVTDAATGRPVVGAKVRAMSVGDIALRFGKKKADVAVTDDDGRFEIHDVKPDRIFVTAQHPDYLPVDVGMASLFSFGSEEAEEEPGVQVMAGQVLEGQDVKLTRGRRVVGVVESADGKPVAGAKIVEVQEAGGMGVFAAALGFGGDQEECFSGVDGRFVLRGRKPDVDLMIGAQHPDHPGGGKVEVKAGVEQAEVKIVMSGMVKLSGRVLLPNGGPAANLDLSFVPENRVAGDRDLFGFEQGVIRVRTDDAGRYRIDAFPVGKSAVHIESSDVAFGPTTTTVQPRIPADRQSFVVREGEDAVHDIQLVEPSVITGTVLMPDGRTPAKDVSLALVVDGEHVEWCWVDDDALGRFAFGDVDPDGVFDVVARSYDVSGEGDDVVRTRLTKNVASVRAGTRDLVIVLEEIDQDE